MNRMKSALILPLAVLAALGMSGCDSPGQTTSEQTVSPDPAPAESGAPGEESAPEVENSGTQSSDGTAAGETNADEMDAGETGSTDGTGSSGAHDPGGPSQGGFWPHFEVQRY